MANPQKNAKGGKKRAGGQEKKPRLKTGVKSKGPAYMQKDQKCAVCGDKSTGSHYRAMTCEGCKGFFRRMVQKEQKMKLELVCKTGGNCVINKQTRNSCQKCRLQKCEAAKMDRSTVLTEPERIDLNEMKTTNKQNNERIAKRTLSVPEKLHTQQIGKHYQCLNFRAFFRFSPEFRKDGQMPHLPGQGSLLMHAYKFVLNIPGVDTIDRDDMVTLITHRLIDVLALQMAEIYDPKEDMLKFCNVTIQESDTLQNKILHLIFKYAKHYAHFCTKDGVILGCLCAVRFLNADDLDLRDREKVEAALEYVLNISNKVWISLKKDARAKLFDGLHDFENIRADKDKLLWKVTGMMEEEDDVRLLLQKFPLDCSEASIESLGRDLSATLAASILLDISTSPSASPSHTASTLHRSSPDIDSHNASTSDSASTLHSASFSHRASTSHRNSPDIDPAAPCASISHSASTSHRTSISLSASTSLSASFSHSASTSHHSSPNIASAAPCTSATFSSATRPDRNGSNDSGLGQEEFMVWSNKQEDGGEEVLYAQTEVRNTCTSLASSSSGIMSRQRVSSSPRPIMHQYTMFGHYIPGPRSSPLAYQSPGSWLDAPVVSSFSRTPETVMNATTGLARSALDLRLRRENRACQGSPARSTPSNRPTSPRNRSDYLQHMRNLSLGHVPMEVSRKQPAPEDGSHHAQTNVCSPTQYEQLVKTVESLNKTVNYLQGQLCKSNGENCVSLEDSVQRSNPRDGELESVSPGSASTGLYSSESAHTSDFRLVDHPEIAHALSTRQLTYRHNPLIFPQYAHQEAPVANSSSSSSQHSFHASPHMPENTRPPQRDTFQSFRPLGDQITIKPLFQADAYRSPPGHALSDDQGTSTSLQDYRYHADSTDRCHPGAPSESLNLQTPQGTSPSLQDYQYNQASTHCYPSTLTVQDSSSTVSRSSVSSVNPMGKGRRPGKSSTTNVSTTGQLRNRLPAIGVKKKWLLNHLREAA